MSANGANGGYDEHEDETGEHPQSWWLSCELTTTMSDPRRHDLKIPEGDVVSMTTKQMLSAVECRARILDAAGVLPPLPDKGAAAFLRAVWPVLFKKRRIVVAPIEASAAGTLRGDVMSCLQSAPQSEDAAAMGRGAVCVRDDGARIFAARTFYEKVRRFCPVSFSPAEFYGALHEIGCVNLETVRVAGWRGRAWSAPAALFEVPQDLPEKATEDPAVGELF